MIRLTVPQIDDEQISQVTKVLKSGNLVQGEQVEAFEQELCDYTKVSHAVVVSSGTAALHLALLGLGIGSGDAVLIPAFSFVATANVVQLVGARPVLVDVAPDTYCLTPEGVRQAIASWSGPERLRAIMPVHEFGAPCDMEALTQLACEYNLLVVEDAACALGTFCSTQGGEKHAGTFGAVGCLSFHPRKSITTGEGGALLTNDPDLAVQLRRLRNHGMERSFEQIEFIDVGLNYRMTDFQAALGRVQLKNYPQWRSHRQQIVSYYLGYLAACPHLNLPKNLPGHAWQSFMVVLSEGIARSTVVTFLKQHGIQSGAGAQAIHCLNYYQQHYHFTADSYPVALTLHKYGLVLPLDGAITKESASLVAESLLNLLPPTIY